MCSKTSYRVEIPISLCPLIKVYPFFWETSLLWTAILCVILCIIKIRLFESRRKKFSATVIQSQRLLQNPDLAVRIDKQMWNIYLCFYFLNREFIHAVQNSSTKKWKASVHWVVSPERINVRTLKWTSRDVLCVCVCIFICIPFQIWFRNLLSLVPSKTLRRSGEGRQSASGLSFKKCHLWINR